MYSELLILVSVKICNVCYDMLFYMIIVFFLEPIIHNVTSSAVSLSNINVFVTFFTDGG